MADPVRLTRHQAHPPHAAHPLSNLDAVHREFDQMLSRFFGGGSTALSNGESDAPFGVDIWEDDHHLYLAADLPGFRKDDVEVDLASGVLTIRAERRATGSSSPRAGEGLDYLLHERRYQRFERAFVLPVAVDENHVEAHLEDGILSLTMTKRADDPHRPHRIPIH